MCWCYNYIDKRIKYCLALSLMARNCVPLILSRVKWKQRRHTLWFGTVAAWLWKHIRNTVVVFNELYTPPFPTTNVYVYYDMCKQLTKGEVLRWDHSLSHIWQQHLCNSWAFDLRQSTEIDHDTQSTPICVSVTNLFILTTLEPLAIIHRDKKEHIMEQ